MGIGSVIGVVVVGGVLVVVAGVYCFKLDD